MVVSDFGEVPFFFCLGTLRCWDRFEGLFRFSSDPHQQKDLDAFPCPISFDRQLSRQSPNPRLLNAASPEVTHRFKPGIIIKALSANTARDVSDYCIPKPENTPEHCLLD